MQMSRSGGKIRAAIRSGWDSCRQEDHHDQPPQNDRCQPAALEPVRSSQSEDEPGEQEGNGAWHGVACEAPHRGIGFLSQFRLPPHRPQSPPDSDSQRDQGVLVGLSSVKALPIKYQPTPTLSRACHASPVNEIDSGNGFVGLP